MARFEDKSSRDVERSSETLLNQLIRKDIIWPLPIRHLQDVINMKQGENEGLTGYTNQNEHNMEILESRMGMLTSQNAVSWIHDMMDSDKPSKIE